MCVPPVLEALLGPVISRARAHNTGDCKAYATQRRYRLSMLLECSQSLFAAQAVESWHSVVRPRQGVRPVQRIAPTN
jgi:hypothetical protein